MLLRNKIEIEKWLETYDIQNYELIPDDKYGYVVNVNESVNLSYLYLKSIDVKFNIIYGYFYCDNNFLKSLDGCPERVNGSFYCSCNKLETLDGCPKIVDGDFNCESNLLKTLIGCPEVIEGWFYCSSNKLTLETIKNLEYVKIKTNKICLIDNKELDDLKEFKDLEGFEKVKEILKIYKEKTALMKAIKVTDKSVVEKTNKI